MLSKALIALFVLLFLLISSCVYLETESLYSDTQATNKEVIKATTNVKTKDISKNGEAQEPVVIEEKPSLLEKIKSAVTSTFDSTEEENIIREVHKANKKSIEVETITNPTTSKINEEEKEVVDYLLSVLKERDHAIEERDTVEAELQILIKKALEARKIAVESMYKEAQESQENQDKRLSQRDKKSKKLNQKTGE